MKVGVVGCGLRTPLLVHGLIHGDVGVSRIALYDIVPAEAALMRELCAPLTGDKISLSVAGTLAEAVTDSSFVISSIRVGGMTARARDERVAVECGCPGQETTGPAGFAMALRTIPEALNLARAVERIAPEAWLINFTNPAGLITQAITSHSAAKTIGICDTPGELIHQIGQALSVTSAELDCDYFGLNHLGWIRRITLDGENCIDRLLGNDLLLRRLYPAEFFPPALLRNLRMLPTEYLFYYYNPRRALENQIKAGATRGEELVKLNKIVLQELRRLIESGKRAEALNEYCHYVNRRNASYMRLEGSAESAFVQQPDLDWNPFEGATGYHRMAVDAIAGLSGINPRKLILNVVNNKCMDELEADDVIEVPCNLDRNGARPIRIGSLPEAVRPLVLTVKRFERLTIRAAMEKSKDAAAFALMSNPIAGSWDIAARYLEKLSGSLPFD